MNATPGPRAVFVDWTDGGDAIMVYTFNVDRDTFDDCTHYLSSLAESDGHFHYVVEPCPHYPDDSRGDDWFDMVVADIEAAALDHEVSVCVG